MKKKFLIFIGLVIVLAVLVPTLIFAGFHFYVDSLFPIKYEQEIDYKNPKNAIVKLSDKINIEKAQIEKNNKKLSGIDWCHYDSKKFKISDVFAEMNDQMIRDVNACIIQLMLPDYLVLTGMQKKKFNNIQAAKLAIDEFEKIVDENKYIKNYDQIKDLIKSVRKKNGL